MWNLHQLATTYHSRPSEIIGVGETWAAYQLDMAVLRFAQYVDEQLEKKRSLRSILEPAPDGAPRIDVSKLGPIQKVTFNPDGTW
jgi:hypothetical protein